VFAVLIVLTLSACDLAPQEVENVAQTVESLPPSELAGLAATIEALPPEDIAAVEQSAAQAGYPTLSPDQVNAVVATVAAAKATATAVGQAVSAGERVNATQVPNQAPRIIYFFQDCPPAAGQVIYRLILDAEDGTSAQKAQIVNVSLVGQTWRLTSYYDGQAMTSVLEGTKITAVFGDDGNLGGFAGCNTCNAMYQVDGNSLTIGSATATQQLCVEPEGIMEQENAFLAALESAATYGVKGSQLIVKNASGQQVLTFEPEPEISPY
jgi:heat shock protein HslJ